MNNFKTTAEGGLPIVLDDFRFIHDSIFQAFKGSMSPFGVNEHTAVILSGCERSLSFGDVTIAEGYVSIGGEICYVPEHSYPTPELGTYEYWNFNTFYDIAGTKLFQNTVAHETYEVREAKIQVGSVPSGYTKYQDAKTFRELINEFIVAQTVNDLLDGPTVNSLITEDTVNDLIDYSAINQNTNTIKTGMIIMWSGAINAIPAGYALCNGSNGTPNLRGRFIVGYDPSNPDYNTIGDTGGQNSFTLSESNIPKYEPVFTGTAMDPHSHTSYPSGQGTGAERAGGNAGGLATDGNGTVSTTSNSAGTPEGTINPFGSDTPTAIDNRPLYYTLAYIIKVADL